MHTIQLSHVNDLRILLTEKTLNIEKVDTDQICILGYYKKVYLINDYIGIIKVLKSAFTKIYSSSSTAAILVAQSKNQITLVNEAHKIYEQKKDVLEREKDFLPLLPLSLPDTSVEGINEKIDKVNSLVRIIRLSLDFHTGVRIR